jgi:hypothetical protein
MAEAPSAQLSEALPYSGAVGSYPVRLNPSRAAARLPRRGVWAYAMRLTAMMVASMAKLLADRGRQKIYLELNTQDIVIQGSDA